MNNLHMCNQQQQLAQVLELLQPQDALLLCGDAAYGFARALQTQARLFVLDEDAQARGLQLPQSITRLDYAQFVRLCIEYAQVISW